MLNNEERLLLSDSSLLVEMLFKELEVGFAVVVELCVCGKVDSGGRDVYVIRVRDNAMNVPWHTRSIVLTSVPSSSACVKLIEGGVCVIVIPIYRAVSLKA